MQETHPICLIHHPIHSSSIAALTFRLFLQSSGRVLSYGKNLKPTGWSWGGGGYGKGSINGFSRFGIGDDGGILSHSSTVDRLYTWEKKLFLDVKVRSSATGFI